MYPESYYESGKKIILTPTKRAYSRLPKCSKMLLSGPEQLPIT